MAEPDGGPTMYEVNRRLSTIEHKIDKLGELSIDRRFTEHETRLGKLEDRLVYDDRQRGITTRQVVLLVIATILTIVGTLVAGIVLGAK